MDPGTIMNAAREAGEELASAAEDLASGQMGGLPMGGFPDVPSVPGAPSLPDVPGGLPDVPSAPEIPSVPDPSGFVPDAGGLVPDAPDVPEMPGVPGQADDAAAAAEERREWLRQQFGDDLGLEGSDPKTGEEERREWLRQEFGDDLGLEGGVGDGYGDVKEEPEDEAKPEAPAVSKDEQDATAVVRVCREGWNTIDTKARGGHWFSA